MRKIDLKVLTAAAVIGIAAPIACTATARASVPEPNASFAVNGIERHPEIRKAIEQLQRARYDLEHASHDFGGHRAEALRATDAAIAQLQIALQYDR